MELRSLVLRYRFLVFASITLALAAVVYLSRVDPMMAPFALVATPALGALITATLCGRAEVMSLFRRVTRWRQSLTLYVVAVGIGIVANLLIVVLAVATGTPASDAFSGLTATALILPLVVFLPALFEEFGWRGFGIPALNKQPLIVSALLVGIPFTVIHLPLHMAGYLYDGLPMWPTILATMSLAVILGWAFAAGGASSLIAGVLHAAANAAVPLTWGLDTVRVWEMRGIAYLIVAVAVVILARRRFMAPVHEDSVPSEAALAPAPAV